MINSSWTLSKLCYYMFLEKVENYKAPSPEVEKVKSVSGNLRIGPKTFCENEGVRHAKIFVLYANGC